MSEEVGEEIEPMHSYNVTTEPKKKGDSIIDTQFIKKPQGYMIIVNMVMAFLTMCLASGWLGSSYYTSESIWSFFIYSTTHTWIIFLIMFLFNLFKLPSRCEMINWKLGYLLNTIIVVVLLLIGSVLGLIKFIGYIGDCSLYNCGYLAVVLVFGVLTLFGCLFECRLFYREWKGIN